MLIPRPTSGSGGAPTDAEYVVTAAHAGLTGERVLVAGTNITVDDSVAGQVTIAASGGGGGSGNTYFPSGW